MENTQPTELPQSTQQEPAPVKQPLRLLVDDEQQDEHFSDIISH